MGRIPPPSSQGPIENFFFRRGDRGAKWLSWPVMAAKPEHRRSTKYEGKRRRWGGLRSSTRSTVPPPEFSIQKPFKVVSHFKDKAFLHQKYVVERLSCEEIAGLISSSRTTVLKWLKLFQIKTRRSDYKNAGNNTPFGTSLKELKAIEQMKVLRERGYSFWKIAEILTAMRIRTKTGRSGWQARTVQRVLENNERKGV